MRADYLEKNSGRADNRRKLKWVAESYTATVEDSGSVFLIDASGATVAITLPECATKDNEMLGWYADFILHTNGNAVTIIATTDDGDNIHGHGIDGEDGAASNVIGPTGNTGPTGPTGSTGPVSISENFEITLVNNEFYIN